MSFQFLHQIKQAAFEAGRPIGFMTVAEAGQKYHEVKASALHRGKWSPELTPYLLEPQEILTSLEYQGVVIVAPARTGKSAVLMNWLAYGAMVDPTDYLLVNSAQHEARRWSNDELKKFLRASIDVREKMIPGRKNDNTYDKEFLSGMRWDITWPTIGNLSAKTIMRHWLLDYDRIPQSVEGEGNPFDLAKKRGETYMRFSKTVAESSPGFNITDPKWMAKTPHEAPPVADGILKLYNRGDRRRWYWQCEQCDETFEPSFSMFDFPGKHDPSSVFNDLMDAAEQVSLPCPHCGYPHTPAMKNHLNNRGAWVREGMVWMPDRSMVRNPDITLARSNIASFWLKGPAAAFQTWENMVLTYLQAEKEFDETGDEKPLTKCFNTDMGEPYLPNAMKSDRSPERLKEKAEDWGAVSEYRSVPAEVRFLIATVDVQARSNAAFVFQVHGFTTNGDIILIDSDRITKSEERRDERGERQRVDPAAFAEDWNILLDEVMDRTYPLADQSGRRMGIHVTACDSGGAEGVTLRAYNFWRSLRDNEERPGLHKKFILVKGGTIENNPTARIIMPDANRKDRNAGAVGDVPVLDLNPWKLKDMVSNMLLRRIREQPDQTGGGNIRYPTWMPEWFYQQVTTEVRTAKGWDNPKNKRNEAWDLLYYALGVALRPFDDVYYTDLQTVRWDKIDWEKPPAWAEVWDKNSTVWSPDKVQQVAEKRKKLSFAELGETLA